VPVTSVRRRRRKPRGERKDFDIRLRVTKAEKFAFTEAAKRDGRGLSNWLRYVAAKAAGISAAP
jgi:hypothetical protein